MPVSVQLRPSSASGSPARGVEAILSAVVFGAQKFLNQPDWSSLLVPWLRQLGESAGVDQVRVFRNDQPVPGDLRVRSSLWAEWMAPGVRASAFSALQHVSFGEAGTGRWLDVLSTGGVVAANTADLPDTERTLLEREGNVAVVIVPVFASGRWWGFLGFADCAHCRDWSQAEVDALTAAAGILGAALSRQELETRVASAAMHAQLAEEIGEVLGTSGLRLDAMLEQCCERIVRYLRADLVRVWTLEPGADTLVSRAAASLEPGEHEPVEVPLGGCAVGRIAATHRSAIWPHALPELWPGSGAYCEAHGLRGGVGHPLLREGVVVGAVVLLSREPLTQSTLDGLWSITDELALAIEHGRATQALHLTEDRYRRLVEATMEGICIHDGRRVHDYNPSLAAMLGLGETPPPDLDPLEFLHPESRDLARRHIAAGYTGTYEATMLRADGTTFPAELKGRSYEYDGMTLRVTAVRDLTDRKQAERAARRLAEEQRAREVAERDRLDAQFLAEASRILASSFDSSTALAQLARLAADGLAECCVVTLLHDGTAQQAAVDVNADEAREGVLRAAMRRLGDRPDHPLVQRQLQGDAFVVPSLPSSSRPGRGVDALLAGLECDTLICAPIKAGGELLGSILLAAGDGRAPYDAHQLAIAEELGRRAATALVAARSYRDALRATRARDEMLAVVAHDLRNPIATIRMAADLALELMDAAGPADGTGSPGAGTAAGGAASAAPAPVGRRQFEIIRRHTHHVNRLIQDLMDASRMEAGQLALDVAPEPAAAILREASDLLRPLAENAGIAFETELADAVPHLAVDRTRVVQVLSNLVGNALKFTPKGGAVRLIVEPHDGGACFTVQDTGPGIGPDQLPHVFGRFWQGKRTDRRGLGLGLAIARGIVDAHGGSIWVESELGAGAAFRFTVPAATTSPA